MREFVVQPHEAEQPKREVLAHAPGSLSALWYVTAIYFGAEAINHLSRGTSFHDLKYFAGETIIAGFAASKGIPHLEEFLHDKKDIKRIDMPATTIAMPQYRRSPSAAER
jgi:hypothetical protein